MKYALRYALTNLSAATEIDLACINDFIPNWSQDADFVRNFKPNIQY
ncbi:hypothetical protein [Enterovibrio sp. 27052020O]